ncbi:MAG: tetratricopeptide repeat protein [Deltaproteobacteria bacterium]|nr:tetratricopeptide repeat protein [Deltaproteobacteria bacterium]
MKTLKFNLVLSLIAILCLLPACRTKSEIRREQEFERLKQEVSQTRGDRAEVDSNVDEMRVEMAKLGNVVEESAQGRIKETEEIRKELAALAIRIQALEQRAVAEELSQKQLAQEKPKAASLDLGRKLFDEGKFDESVDIFRAVVKAQPKSEDGKKAQFLLGESLFSTKDYASAVLAFSEFRKSFSQDALIPNAIYRQATSFREMGQNTDAKLFYQDLIERFPKSPFARKAKIELKRLK